MKNLPLDQSIIYGISDAMLYQTRLFEVVKGKYKGFGPNKAVLETRKCNEQLRRVKETAFTHDDLNEVFELLGLPKDDCEDNLEMTDSEREDDDSIDEAVTKGNKRKLDVLANSPLLNELKKRRKVLENNQLNETSPHTFKEKTPQKKDLKDLRNQGAQRDLKGKYILVGT